MNKENQKNNNNFIGNTFDGQTQIAGQIINNPPSKDDSKEKATYVPEPIWRSPFTMAVLTWISVFIGIIGILPIGKIIGTIVSVFNSSLKMDAAGELQTWTGVFGIVIMLFVICVSLRRITKRQTRHPLFCNLAISGYGKRVTVEKMHIDKCPQCGGEMRYYNKPVEWVVYYSDGKVKREVTKRVPVLECKRNSEHCYIVDCAEDKVD